MGACILVLLVLLTAHHRILWIRDMRDKVRCLDFGSSCGAFGRGLPCLGEEIWNVSRVGEFRSTWLSRYLMKITKLIHLMGR
jgi:hypothetical protein